MHFQVIALNKFSIQDSLNKNEKSNNEKVAIKVSRLHIEITRRRQSQNNSSRGKLITNDLYTSQENDIISRKFANTLMEETMYTDVFSVKIFMVLSVILYFVVILSERQTLLKNSNHL